MGGGAAMIAIDAQGNALGFMSLAAYAVLHAMGAVAMITAFVVTEYARGHGVGRQLVDAARTWARARGCARSIVTAGRPAPTPMHSIPHAVWPTPADASPSRCATRNNLAAATAPGCASVSVEELRTPWPRVPSNTILHRSRCRTYPHNVRRSARTSWVTI